MTKSSTNVMGRARVIKMFSEGRESLGGCSPMIIGWMDRVSDMKGLLGSNQPL